MKRFCLSLILFSFALASLLSAEEAPRPNILFILVDDLGWKDVGCYGSEMCETPNLDQLAAEGVRFTDGYAPAPICSASRAAILTGKSPARLHFEFVTKDAAVMQDVPGMKLKTPPYTLNLPLKETTVAEMLAEQGYSTAFFGKWHVNQHYQRYLGWSPTHGPAQQGFQTAIEDFGGHPYNKDLPKKTNLPVGIYPGDSMTDKAIRFLKSRKNKQEPFYLQVNHFYVHTPVKVQAKWLYEKYQQQLRSGESKEHAVFSAFVEILDHHIGRLLDALDSTGQSENTLVVFLSDNGGDPRYSEHAPLRGHKWTLHEGGIRVPMMARWPGKFKAGEVCSSPVIGTDLFPTFAAVAGDRAQRANLDGQSLLPLLLEDHKSTFDNRTLIWHFPYYHPEKNVEKLPRVIGINDPVAPFLGPQSAIRSGPYKGFYFHESDSFALYNLDENLSETVDLSENSPELAKELKQKMMDSLNAVDARMPQPFD
ncbi:Aryl-sulfate sulfohydrolase [Planctomycetales bacterium 10988]|nr:Aryl-sulfate sulfohydrolase [Planctomycetales bacterium 10988]